MIEHKNFKKVGTTFIFFPKKSLQVELQADCFTIFFAYQDNKCFVIPTKEESLQLEQPTKIQRFLLRRNDKFANNY